MSRDMIRRMVAVSAKDDYDGILAVIKLIPLVNLKTLPEASRSSKARVTHTPVVNAQTKPHTPLRTLQ